MNRLYPWAIGFFRGYDRLGLLKIGIFVLTIISASVIILLR